MVMLTQLAGLMLGTIVLELLLYQKHVWRIRRYVAIGLITLLPAVTGATVAYKPNVFTILLLIVSAGRLFNLLRLIEGRSPEPYLRRSAFRASCYFGLSQALIVLAIPLELQYRTAHLLLALAALQVLVAVVLLLSTFRSLRKSRPLPPDQHYADKELPTVSVLIPARNETEDLEACLHSIIASNYPKLEIVVLDDCSRDRTPEVIRSFAQDGVRFISGIEPSKSWLAKNAAYDRLSKAATGEVLLFCGVDTRFGRNTIHTLVATMLSKNKQMISVLPLRLMGGLQAALIQPMRYWWELALPRRYFNRPPVLSSCWLIHRKTLKKLGGFASAKQAIIPEMLFARQLVGNDAYSFIRAEGELELATRKSWHGQRDTAVRVRYPQVHRRPELAVLLSVLELTFLLGPFVVLIAGLLLGALPVAILAALAALALLVTHMVIVTATDPANAPLALFNFPLAVLTEITLGLVSMAKYEFSVVEWKGRNICIPVMQAVPQLPKQ
jgi:MFS family permease